MNGRAVVMGPIRLVRTGRKLWGRERAAQIIDGVHHDNHIRLEIVDLGYIVNEGVLRRIPAHSAVDDFDRAERVTLREKVFESFRVAVRLFEVAAQRRRAAEGHDPIFPCGGLPCKTFKALAGCLEKGIKQANLGLIVEKRAGQIDEEKYDA